MSAQSLSLLGGLVAIVSLSIYIAHVMRGRAKPNPATWLIWLLVGLINLVTYFSVVNDSLVRAAVLCVATSGVVVVTVYSVMYGKFARLGRTDWICLALALAVGTFWQISGDPVRANLLLQGVYAISFVPTVAGLRNHTLTEETLPWGLAVVAYSLMTASVLVDWQNSHWVALAHPITNGVVGHGVVAYYAWSNRPRVKDIGMDIFAKPALAKRPS